MLIRLVLIVFLLVPCSVSALLRGSNSAWNGSLLGGGWVCFQAQITGCSQGFNAACDGVTDDKVAWNNFLTYASGVSMAKLYIPPGANCTNSDGFKTTIPGANLHINGTKVPGLIIWGYGAAFDTIFLGVQGAIFPDNTHNALLQNSNVNDSTITLKNVGDASIFSVGKWIIISGLSLQRFGYPPNWFVFEYRKIAAINGSIITLNTPLSYSYKSTWPQNDVGDATNVNLGGPAMAYVLNDAWDQDLTIYGLRIKQPVQINTGIRSATLNAMVFDSVDGPAPSIANSFTITNSFVQSPEFDKMVDTLILNHVSGPQLLFQSASFNHVVISDSTITSVLNGTPNNAIISNLTTPEIRMGPTGYGHGTSFSIANSSVGTARGNNICMPSVASGTSGMTFSGGTFTASKSGTVDKDNLLRWAIPGQKYYFAANDGTNDSIPHTQFAITDLREDASNYYVDTDIGASLPTPSCNGITPCPCYSSYQASSVMQTNTGPADLTQFAAP